MTRVIENNTRLSHSLLFFCALLIFPLLGCSGSDVADTTPTPVGQSSSEDKSTSTETVSVSPDLANRKSPAETNKASLDTTPEDVCQNFMHFLRDGKRIEAENLLTRTALTVTTQAGLQLEPMGGPAANYSVNEVRFATNKAKLAQVECSIVETVDGETYEMDVVWLTRKQPNGWRISGVMLELENSSVKDLLSFENMQDVTKIKNIAGSDILEDDATRQAKSSEPTIK